MCGKRNRVCTTNSMTQFTYKTTVSIELTICLNRTLKCKDSINRLAVNVQRRPLTDSSR
jgi:hypothetical protein